MWRCRPRLPPPMYNSVGLLSLCACVGFATCVCLTPAEERGDRGEEGEIATLVAEVATKKKLLWRWTENSFFKFL